MKRIKTLPTCAFTFIAIFAFGLLSVRLQHAQQPSPTPSPTPLPPTLGLEQGYLEFDTPLFKVKLVKASQTIAALQPKGAEGFDFTPGDRLERRAANGYHHLGDLTLRLRTGNTGPWQKYDTAEARNAERPTTIYCALFSNGGRIRGFGRA